MHPQPTDPASLGSLPLLDESAIAALRDPDFGGDRAFLAEVVEAFLDDTPARIEDLRTGLAGRDADAVARAAHSMKGSSGNFGAARMQTLCAEIERLGRTGRLEVVGPLVGQLDAEYAVLAGRLAELVAEASAPHRAAS